MVCEVGGYATYGEGGCGRPIGLPLVSSSWCLRLLVCAFHPFYRSLSQSYHEFQLPSRCSYLLQVRQRLKKGIRTDRALAPGSLGQQGVHERRGRSTVQCTFSSQLTSRAGRGAVNPLRG